MTHTLAINRELKIVWEKLPENFILPEEPVENIIQPLLAAALTEALDLAGLITPVMLIASNLGICTKINNQTVVKAPDWFYVPRVISIGEGVIRRSYTPHTEGDIPAIVMEFISENDSGEYSVRPTYPYGKLWFYERILQVPIYVTFDSSTGILEVRQLTAGRYEIISPDANVRYSIPSLNLYLGVWYGRRLEITTHWLRWWDKSGNLLLWGSEQVQQRQQERKRAEVAEQEIVKLRELLKKAGISESDSL